jgi:hypothetical protein
MMPNKKQHLIIAILVILWATYLSLVTLFYPASGDAPNYFYGIRRMVDGLVPTLDFFSIQPPGFYLPYYIVAKLMAPSWELLRYISLISFFATTFFVTHIIGRKYGTVLGIVGFLIIGCSHFWFYWNVNIIHYSVSNVTMLGAFYLIFSANPTRTTALAAGLIAGLCVNARLSMGPATIILLYLLIQRLRDQSPNLTFWEAFQRLGWPYLFGGILISIPSLLILFADPEATYQQLLGLRANLASNRVWVGDTIWQQVFSALERRAIIVHRFFFWADDSLKAQIGNSIILAISVLAALGFFVSKKDKKMQAFRAFCNDPPMRGAGLLALGVFLTHAFTILPSPYYVQVVFPLLTISLLGAVHYGFQHVQNRQIIRGAQSLIGFLLVPYLLYFFFWTGAHLIRRNEPSSARPVTNAQVACWIEQNTSPNAKIISHSGWPIAAGNRHMVANWTYPSFQTILVNWDIDPAVAEKAHILTKEELLKLFNSQELDVFVDEKSAAYDLRKLTKINKAIDSNYKLAATSGGAFPFDIYLPNRLWRENLPQIPLPPTAKLTMTRLKQANVQTLVGDVVADVGSSLKLLGSDIPTTYLRLIDAPFEERCRAYLARAGGQALKMKP